MALSVVALSVVALSVVALPVVALPVVALPVMALPVMALPVMALPVMALSVVGDRDLHFVIGPAEPDLGRPRVGMLHRVGERLLHDAVRGQIGVGGQVTVNALDREPHAQPGTAHVLDQAGQGVDGRPRRADAVVLFLLQDAQQTAKLRHRVPARVGDRVEDPFGPAGIGADHHRPGLGLNDHDTDGVREHVVHVAGDAGPLLRRRPRRLGRTFAFQRRAFAFELRRPFHQRVRPLPRRPRQRAEQERRHGQEQREHELARVVALDDQRAGRDRHHDRADEAPPLPAMPPQVGDGVDGHQRAVLQHLTRPVVQRHPHGEGHHDQRDGERRPPPPDERHDRAQVEHHAERSHLRRRGERYEHRDGDRHGDQHVHETAAARTRPYGEAEAAQPI